MPNRFKTDRPRIKPGASYDDNGSMVIKGNMRQAKAIIDALVDEYGEDATVPEVAKAEAARRSPSIIPTK